MSKQNTEPCYETQAAPPPPPPPAAPSPLVAQPPQDPMGLADVVATAAPGWYAPPFLCQCACALLHALLDAA